jgi:hypothetical protein
MEVIKMNIYEAIQALSGHIDYLSGIGFLEEEELKELSEIEQTIRNYIVDKEMK